MNKVIDFIKNHRLVCIGAGAAVLVIVIIIVVVTLLLSNKTTQEDKLKSSLEALGRRYYEDFYYVQAANTEDISQKKEFLKSFTTVGMRVPLETLLKYNEESENKDTTEYKNKKKKQDCDKKKSVIIIYPKEEYGQKDYDIKVELVCGFDN